jgi:hypothetical protein
MPMAYLTPVSTILAENFTPVASCHQYQRHQQKICHGCRWHPWQIMGSVSDYVLNLKVKLKENIYLFVNSTTQRWPNKIIKTFLIEDFIHLPPVSMTSVAHLELRLENMSWKSCGTVPLSRLHLKIDAFCKEYNKIAYVHKCSVHMLLYHTECSSYIGSLHQLSHFSHVCQAFGAM